MLDQMSSLSDELNSIDLLGGMAGKRAQWWDCREELDSNVIRFLSKANITFTAEEFIYKYKKGKMNHLEGC